MLHIYIYIYDISSLRVNSEIRERRELDLHTHVNIHDWVLEVQEGLDLYLPGEATRKVRTRKINTSQYIMLIYPLNSLQKGDFALHFCKLKS